MKRLAILGSTGSIGVSTLEIVTEHPDCFEVVALTAGRNLALLEEQIARFRPQPVAVRLKIGLVSQFQYQEIMS